MKNLFLALFVILIAQSNFAQTSGCVSGDCSGGFGTYIWGGDTDWAGDTYVGSWQDGLMSGHGTYYYTDGRKYVGNYVNNKRKGQGVFTWSDGSIYTGEFANGYREGYGTYIWSDKQKYEGYWKRGEQHGSGEHTYANGNVKSGIWKEGSYVGKEEKKELGCITGNCTNGYGTYVWKSGEKYDGYWKNDKRSGQGTNYYADGGTYVGNWLNDQQHGEGTVKYNDGSKYSGNFSYHKRKGFGTYTFSDERKYVGQWDNGKYNGYGTMYKTDGTTQSGEWKDDVFVGGGSNYNNTKKTGCLSGNCGSGYGVYAWESGERYEGYWENDMRNGEGTNYYSTGAKCTGNWKNDKKHGFASYTHNQSSLYKSYSGDYVSDKMTGHGTLIQKKGDKYIGSFKDGVYQGEGTMYYADGTSKSGYWEDHKFVGKSKNNYGCILGNCSDGFGTYTWENGGKYVGYWKDGKLHGSGTYYSNNSDKYTGDFAYGKFHGFGTHIFASDGRRYVGEWNKSKCHGQGTMYYSNGDIKSGLWENSSFIGKTAGTPPIVSWITPSSLNTTSTSAQYPVKLCIESKSELTSVQIYVNGIMQNNPANRGFKVVADDCNFNVNENIKLSGGANKIKVVITNKNGSTDSDIRTVEYKTAIQERRLALVIGNSAYKKAPLRNPENDARSIATELRNLGFEVMLYTNLSQNDMKRQIRTFGEKLVKQKGVGLFYFAGHGIQMNGSNYLIPVSAVIEKEQDVELEAVNLMRVLGELDYAQNNLNIVILDACRNNPFVRSFRSGGNNGLASTIAPQGTFIAYATAPGSVASDGSGSNGLYTEEFIKALRKPGLKIEDVFKQVRNNVYQRSNKMQVPWENSSIFGDFYFRK